MPWSSGWIEKKPQKNRYVLRFAPPFFCIFRPPLELFPNPVHGSLLGRSSASPRSFIFSFLFHPPFVVGHSSMFSRPNKVTRTVEVLPPWILFFSLYLTTVPILEKRTGFPIFLSCFFFFHFFQGLFCFSDVRTSFTAPLDPFLFQRKAGCALDPLNFSFIFPPSPIASLRGGF